MRPKSDTESPRVFTAVNELPNKYIQNNYFEAYQENNLTNCRSINHRYYIISGIPLVIVGISVGVGYDKYGTEQACWIDIESGLIWTLVGPVALLILINLLFLSMTVCKMYKNSMTFSDAGKINSVK